MSPNYYLMNAARGDEDDHGRCPSSRRRPEDPLLAHHQGALSQGAAGSRPTTHGPRNATLDPATSVTQAADWFPEPRFCPSGCRSFHAGPATPPTQNMALVNLCR